MITISLLAVLGFGGLTGCKVKDSNPQNAVDLRVQNNGNHHSCGIGSAAENDMCVCGKMKYAPAISSQWVCVDGILRCFLPDGCALHDQKYSLHAEIRNGTVFLRQRNLTKQARWLSMYKPK